MDRPTNQPKKLVIKLQAQKAINQKKMNKSSARLIDMNGMSKNRNFLKKTR